MGSGTNPQPCPVTAINPDIRNAYVTEWNFGIQHAFTGSMSLEVSYVGNHATHLWGLIDENAAMPGSNVTAAEQLRRPYSSRLSLLIGDQLYFGQPGIEL